MRQDSGRIPTSMWHACEWKRQKPALMTARLSYLPSLGISAEGSGNKYDGATAKAYNVGASASWELELFGKLTAAKRGAVAALQGSRDYRQAVQTQLVATIADSYYTLALLDAQKVINHRTWKTGRLPCAHLKR